MIINIGFCIYPSKNAIGKQYVPNGKTIKQVRYTSFKNQENKIVSIIFTDDSQLELPRTTRIEING